MQFIFLPSADVTAHEFSAAHSKRAVPFLTAYRDSQLQHGCSFGCSELTLFSFWDAGGM